MSKDNTIVILETLGPEFRVQDIQAAENLTYHDPAGDLIEIYNYFWEAPVFLSKSEAYNEVSRLEQEDIDCSGWGSEYGTWHLTLNQEFPKVRPRCPAHKLDPKCSPPMCLRCSRGDGHPS